MVFFYGYFLFGMAATGLIGCVGVMIILDRYLFHEKKWYGVQLIFNVLSLLVYLLLVIIVFITYLEVNSYVFLISTVLMGTKGVRVIIIATSFINSRKNQIYTRIKFNSLRTRPGIALILIFLFILPLMVFGLGFTDYSLEGVNIEISEQSQPGRGKQPIQISFYASLASYDYIMDEKVLKALSGEILGDEQPMPAEVLMFMEEQHISSQTEEGKKIADMVKACNDHGINVWVWFVYTRENGFYPSFEDYELLPKFKQYFDDWVEQYSLEIKGILYDNEMDEAISQLDLNADLLGYLDAILERREMIYSDQENAVAMYESISQQWKQEQGYDIALVGMENSIYDQIDGDQDLQYIFGIINNPPDMWERVSFMFYRHCEYHANSYTPDYLYLLSNLHKRLYKHRAAVAIGCMSYPAYDTINEILTDIAILKFLNISTVEIFEFRAFYAKFGYDGLISILRSSSSDWKHPKFRINFHTQEFLMRGGAMLGDVLLDLFNPIV